MVSSYGNEMRSGQPSKGPMFIMKPKRYRPQHDQITRCSKVVVAAGFKHFFLKSGNPDLLTQVVFLNGRLKHQ